MSFQISLYNMDCLEYLSVTNKVFDLVVMDLPYAISTKSGFSGGKNKKFTSINTEYGDWDSTESLRPESLLPKLYNRICSGGTAILFYPENKISNLWNLSKELGFYQQRIIIWKKTNPVPKNSRINYLTGAFEMALSITKPAPKKTFNSVYNSGIYEFPIEHSKYRIHNTQKPVKLIQSIIEDNANPGDLIFDGCFGSGTTAVSAYNSGMVFIGCENNEHIYSQAVARIKNQTKIPNNLINLEISKE